MTNDDKTLARSDHPSVSSGPDPRGDLIAQFEGRKRTLLLGPHYTTEPLSKDHRDDILRWVHDLDAAITFLKGHTDGRVHEETGRGLVAVRVHEAEGRQADTHQAERSEASEVQEVRNNQDGDRQAANAAVERLRLSNENMREYIKGHGW